jgi:nucleoside-diphosphate-sugar epimerase
MHILVTGGAGYLGSILVEELVKRVSAEHITVVDNFMYRQQSLNHLCVNPMFNIIQGDVRDGRLMRELCRRADVIIPLAAIVGAPACDRNNDAALSTNQFAVMEMFERGLDQSQMVVFPNTNSGYGIGGEELCDERSPLRPLSLYGQVKVEAEKQVMGHPGGISLRFATLFGASPRMRLDLMVNEFVYRAVRDKTLILYEQHFRRNFLHVRDAARAICHVISRKLTGEIFNVGDSRANMTKAELASLIGNCVPGLKVYQGDGADPDKRDYVVSNTKIMRAGWAPRHTLEQGIKELIRCYQQPFEGNRNA